MSISILLLDLDGTLYPNQNGIWEAIAARMETYMQRNLKIPQAEIRATRMNYYQQYGTTLRGLQANYQIDPFAFLKYVHDIPIKDFIQPDKELDTILSSLPQEKWIFTNSDRNHANRVLDALGIEHHISGILDIIKLEFDNKPSPDVYKKALEMVGNPLPANCLFADDSEKNLIPAKKHGWKTVLVGTAFGPSEYQPHIQSIHQLPTIITAIEHASQSTID